MKAELIDLNDYVHAGEGANGESLNHKTDPSVMIKLYNASARMDLVESELEFARKVYATGIPTPKPGEFITDGNGRYGIRFERIKDKVSFSRAVGESHELVEPYAREFARMCKKLHSTHVSKSEFPSVKEADLKMLEENPYFTLEQKEKIAAFIKAAPDCDTAIHGDLQFSNAIRSGNKCYFIDLGDFSYGHPYFDLGMVLLTCRYDSEEFVRTVFHMDLATASEFWVYFVKEYFGEDVDPDEMDKEIRPYAGLKTLLIEKCAGCAMPEFHSLLDGILKK